MLCNKCCWICRSEVSTTTCKSSESQLEYIPLKPYRGSATVHCPGDCWQAKGPLVVATAGNGSQTVQGESLLHMCVGFTQSHLYPLWQLLVLHMFAPSARTQKEFGSAGANEHEQSESVKTQESGCGAGPTRLGSGAPTQSARASPQANGEPAAPLPEA